MKQIGRTLKPKSQSPWVYLFRIDRLSRPHFIAGLEFKHSRKFRGWYCMYYEA